jgi:beta-lactam-binding protein with PASTA domain
MGTGRYPDGTAADAADASAEETTLADEEWPVAEQYRVEPAEQPVEDGTVVVEQLPPEPDEPATPIRRFPPEVGPGLVATLVAVLLLLLLIPGGFWLATRTDDAPEAAAGPEPTLGTMTGPTTTEAPATTAPAAKTVPEVEGRPLAEARELLEKAELTARFRRVDSDRPANEVLSQSPEGGSDAQAGSVVVLTVSGGAARIAVPEVEGLTAGEAKAALREAGLRFRTSSVPSDEVKGTVVDQSPAAGAEVSKQTVVTLVVSEARSAPKPTTIGVPSLVGLRAADARSRLRELGLRSTQQPVESQLPEGEVVSQSPRAGAEVREGATVTLRVSTGPASVAIPSVVGLNEAAARRELEAAGFAVQVADEPTTDQAHSGIVLAQSPSAGTSARQGATVTITVARFA